MKNVEEKTNEVIVEKDIIEKNQDNKEDVIKEVETKDEIESEDEACKDVQSNAENDSSSNLVENSQEVSGSEAEVKSDSTKIEVDEPDKKCELLVKKKSHKPLIVASISFAFILAALLIFSIIFALMASNSSTIINGVSIKDVDVSGLTKEQALEKVTSAFNEKLAQKITLKHKDYQIEIFANQFNVSFDLAKAVDSAYSLGRTGNIFENNYNILGSKIYGSKVTPNFTFNEDSLVSLVKEIETNFPDKLINSSYYIEENNLVLSKGKDGVVIDYDNLKNDIIYVINNWHSDTNEIDIPVEYKQTTALDIEKIHGEVYRAPQNAYYTTNPYVVYPHVDGIDFSISVEDAINGYTAAKESFTIPLQVLSPEVTTNQIGTEAFPDLLGTFSTTFSTRNVNRSTNIRLAAEKINGTVVMPGETFSYNQTVGRRTAAAGFKAAAVYSGGEVTTGIGGGICQVSSTLYNSVLLANLDIVERYNHGFNPGYVPAGRDATVSWGGPDFKFKNNRNYPVRVVCSVSGGTILAQIFGLKAEDDYDVEIESYITSYIAYKTIQKNDSTLPKGTTKVLQSGSSGCRSVCYRILKKNGEVVSKTLLSNDTYNPHNKIVAVGTKQ